MSPGFALDLGLVKYLILGAKYNSQILYYLDHSDLNDLFHNLDLDIGLDLSNVKSKRWRNFRLGTEIDLTPVSLSVTSTSGTSSNTTQRFLGALVPGYYWRISSHMSLDFETRIQRIMFLGQGVNSNTGEALVSFRRRFLRKFIFVIGGRGTYQDFEGLGVTTILGANVGLDLEFYKRLNGGVSAGMQRINLPGGAGTGDAITIGADLNYLLSKRTNFNLVLNRSNSVDINNNNFVSLTGSLGARHRLSARSEIGLSVFYHVTEQEVVNLGQLLTDELTSIGVGLRWQFTKHWTFGLNAYRDNNDGQFSSNDYNQNRFGLEVRYNFPFKFH